MRMWIVIVVFPISGATVYGPCWTRKGANKLADKIRSLYSTPKVTVDMIWKF